VTITPFPLSLDACLREAASAKAGERAGVRVKPVKGRFKKKTLVAIERRCV